MDAHSVSTLNLSGNHFGIVHDVQELPHVRVQTMLMDRHTDVLQRVGPRPAEKLLEAAKGMYVWGSSRSLSISTCPTHRSHHLRGRIRAGYQAEIGTRSDWCGQEHRAAR